MNEHITSSPLYWPEGWKREAIKVQSRFKSPSIDAATKFVIYELFHMGISEGNIIISTNLKLRNDGYPYSKQPIPEDVGVAVWWKDDGEQRVIALDKYDKIADNIHAIGKTIEAMRGIERWGGGEILNRTFAGFTALPSPDHVVARSWRDVLDYYGDDLLEAHRAYLTARKSSHPDKGGSTKEFIEVNTAWAQCQKELK